MKSGSSNSGGSNKGKDPAGLSSLIASEDENDFEGENDERPAVDATTEIMNLNLVGTFCQARCSISAALRILVPHICSVLTFTWMGMMPLDQAPEKSACIADSSIWLASTL